MAQPPDFYMKQLVGEYAAQIAILRAENEALREQLAATTKTTTKTSRTRQRTTPNAA